MSMELMPVSVEVHRDEDGSIGYDNQNNRRQIETSFIESTANDNINNNNSNGVDDDNCSDYNHNSDEINCNDNSHKVEQADAEVKAEDVFELKVIPTEITE